MDIYTILMNMHNHAQRMDPGSPLLASSCSIELDRAREDIATGCPIRDIHQRRAGVHRQNRVNPASHILGAP